MLRSLSILTFSTTSNGYGLLLAFGAAFASNSRATLFTSSMDTILIGTGKPAIAICSFVFVCCLPLGLLLDFVLGSEDGLAGGAGSAGAAASAGVVEAGAAGASSSIQECFRLIETLSPALATASAGSSRPTTITPFGYAAADLTTVGLDFAGSSAAGLKGGEPSTTPAKNVFGCHLPLAAHIGTTGFDTKWLTGDQKRLRQKR